MAPGAVIEYFNVIIIPATWHHWVLPFVLKSAALTKVEDHLCLLNFFCSFDHSALQASSRASIAASNSMRSIRRVRDAR